MATRTNRVDSTLDAIVQLALTTNWTPAQVHREIEGREDFKGRVLNYGTVERIVKEFRQPVTSEAWSFRDSDGDDANLILEVRRELIRVWDHPSQRISKKEAHWVVKIRKAAPDLNPATVWLVAVMYSLRERDDAATEDLDDYLAFAPWRDKQHFDEYNEWIQRGWISPPPLSDRLVGDFRQNES